MKATIEIRREPGQTYDDIKPQITAAIDAELDRQDALGEKPSDVEINIEIIEDDEVTS